jgi:hypothetical protein
MGGAAADAGCVSAGFAGPGAAKDVPERRVAAKSSEQQAAEDLRMPRKRGGGKTASKRGPRIAGRERSAPDSIVSEKSLREQLDRKGWAMSTAKRDCLPLTGRDFLGCRNVSILTTACLKREAGANDDPVYVGPVKDGPVMCGGFMGGAGIWAGFRVGFEA